jgi:hypothetical protein
VTRSVSAMKRLQCRGYSADHAMNLLQGRPIVNEHEHVHKACKSAAHRNGGPLCGLHDPGYRANGSSKKRLSGGGCARDRLAEVSVQRG